LWSPDVLPCAFIIQFQKISHIHNFILVYKSQQDAHVTEFILSDNATHSTLKLVPTLPQ